jgi:hypothetical protein
MIWLIGVPSYLMLAWVAYFIELRIHYGRYAHEDATVFSLVWPLRLALLVFFLVVMAPVGLGLLIGRVFKASHEMIDRFFERRQMTTEDIVEPEPEPPPHISIPRGAALGSKEYRQLKPMIEKFEASLPVHERE